MFSIGFMLRNNLFAHLAKYSPKISPPQPLYSIPVCKKFSCNYYEIDTIGIFADPGPLTFFWCTAYIVAAYHRPYFVAYR